MKTRPWLGPVLFAGVLLLLGLAFRPQLSEWFAGPAAVTATAPSASSHQHGPDDVDHYTCPMHPSVNQKGPGKCPICGMDLTPVTRRQQEQGVLFIDEARRQLIGVKTEAVVEAPLARTTRAVGRVAYDESTLTDVNVKVSGFITKLLVNKTGQRVAAGQTLFTYYSPELYNAQQDFLLAQRGGSGSPESLGRAARQRLHLLGMSEPQISALESKGTVSESIAVASPASGFVIEKDVVAGAAIEAGMRLFRIAALNKVWVEAELYEADLARVRPGDAAKVTLDYLPGRAYDAKVAYVYPAVDATARTGRVRFELGNKELELRPGMFASVELAGTSEPRLQVPTGAVVYTGPRRLVFVDLGEGRLRPQEVRVGQEVNGKYEVLSGLNPGDVVATSGVFLIAAEARIATAAKYWDKAAEPAPSAAPLPSAETASPPLPSALSAPQKSPKTSAPKPEPAADYTCPMHPEVHSPVPGQCPKCGMNLERVK